MVHLAPHGPFPPYSWICSWHLPKTSRQLPCLLSFSVQHEAQMSELARHCSTIRTQSGHGDTSAEEGTSIGQEFDHFGEAKNHDQTKTMSQIWWDCSWTLIAFLLSHVRSICRCAWLQVDQLVPTAFPNITGKWREGKRCCNENGGLDPNKKTHEQKRKKHDNSSTSFHSIRWIELGKIVQETAVFIYMSSPSNTGAATNCGNVTLR